VGIANVTLNLYLDANSNSIIDAGDSIITTQTTDANGNYLFTGLLAGSYIVDVVNSTVPANYQLTTNNDPKPVALAGGQDYLQADFGYAPVSSISGYVYKDAGNDGLWDGTERRYRRGQPDPDRLRRSRQLCRSEPATTDGDGYYSFTGLRPSDPNLGYTVTEAQPPLYFDGKDTAGSTGGDTSVNDVISGIVLPAGVDSINNNFGELPPALISGYVYKDAGNDGVWDGTGAGISWRQTDLDRHQRPRQGRSTGGFLGHRRSLRLCRPAPRHLHGHRDPAYQAISTARTRPALPPRAARPAAVTGNDVISGITLVAGGVSSDNNFGEIVPGGLSGFVYVDANDSGTRQVFRARDDPVASLSPSPAPTTSAPSRR
jgi:hypothetical protein